MVTGGAYGRVGLWHVGVEAGKCDMQIAAVCEGNCAAILSAEFSPDGEFLFTVSADGSVFSYPVSGIAGTEHALETARASEGLAAQGAPAFTALGEVEAASEVAAVGADAPSYIAVQERKRAEVQAVWSNKVKAGRQEQVSNLAAELRSILAHNDRVPDLERLTRDEFVIDLDGKEALLNEARIPLSAEFEVEYSHHYGIPKFREHGAVIINCINREYCKKIVVQLPGQKHPAHYHKLKEETFQVLHGILHLTRDGQERTFHPGDTCLVMPGVWHSFWTETGCVFEEVSTTHHNHDSIYRDPAINDLPREARKTAVDHWGRYQLPSMIREEVEADDSV